MPELPRMKIGVVTLIWTGGFSRSDLDLIPKLKERGFDGVEIIAFDTGGFPAAEVRKATQEAGLQCNFTTAFTGDTGFVSEDATARRRAAAYARECIQMAAEMGSRLFCGPLYAPIGYMPGRRRTEEEWKQVVEGLVAAGEYAEKFQVTLGVEPLNRYESYFLNVAADAAALCDEVNRPNVGVLFDFYHANIEEKDIPAAIRLLGKRIVDVHASENDRGVPGSGHTDWPGAIRALKQAGYGGMLVIEGFGFRIQEIAAATCIWRDVASSPEAVAFEGLKYLREQVAACSAA